ncbi:MAG TPA: S53 family peptidase [Bryobacteraceae bacterium]|nr:S53 family peptidase [Bryobacteraceae bacterium]
MLHPRWPHAFAGSLCILITATSLWSQPASRALVRGRIDEARRVTLAGNTRPETVEGTDLGPVASDLALDHVLLQLRRSPEAENELTKLIDNLHDPTSPQFHQWLTAEEFGARFGTAQSDMDTVTAWLGSHGLQVNFVYPSQMVIDFSGNAGEIQETFHTSIHRYDVGGVSHIANAGDPEIPEALAPVVAGIVSLHDFRPHHMARPHRKPDADYSFTQNGQAVQALVPADLATIYDFNPLFAKGVAGKGQTIVVIEDTELYRASDWTTFRTTFGLSQYTNGSLSQVQPAPSGGPACFAPTVNSDDIEAILDVEWASAAAPDAAIESATCADTKTTPGIYLATQNVVNSSSAPAIVSMSYGLCEAYNGAAANAQLNSIFQQAVTEGISIFVSAGDEDAASCDAGLANATHGIGVSGYASSPYVVAVGGTDFGDVSAGTSSTYWGTTNTATYGSALSYIPEIPWNDSCANGLLARWMGYSTTYGSAGFCGSAAARSGGYLVVAGGSGGPSGCAVGAPSTYGVVSGTCQGYPKPSWQKGVEGIANDGVRDIPDVSMFASDGWAWNHFAIICFSDIRNGGAACKGSPMNWVGIGGTSLAAPMMAGIQALINQTAGSAQGNPNPVYYSLAATTPGVFHTVTQGDIDVNCGGVVSCYGYLGTPTYGRAGRVYGTTYGGVLSLSTSSLQPAYTAGASWNFATGLGSVDVNALVGAWPKK